MAISQPPHSDDWRPGASRDTLRRRARMLERIRDFFAARSVLEVETPVIQAGANLDHGISPMTVAADVGHLITSPEHALKRLVAAGYGDVWSLGPVFRHGEQGRRHNPEFRMIEWYRQGYDLQQMAVETLDLLAAASGLPATCHWLSYHDAFATYAGCDPATDQTAVLAAVLAADEAQAADNDRALLLDLIMTQVIQPRLPQDRWTIIDHFPADQAAQARCLRDAQGRAVAARFEIYRGPLELANGYHEETDPGLLRDRLGNAYQGPGDPPYDERFLAAMAAGLPDCAGVAVGFDRLCMVACNLTDIDAAMAFSWARR